MIIKEKREKKNWSQAKLGYKLGVPQQTIHRWENQESKPSYDKLLALSNVLGVSVKTIVSDYVGNKNLKKGW